MLEIKLTDNYAGFTISGDYKSLDAFHDALHSLIFSQYYEASGYNSMKMYILSVAYDVRKAFEGYREVEIINETKIYSVNVYMTQVLYLCFMIPTLELLLNRRKNIKLNKIDLNVHPSTLSKKNQAEWYYAQDLLGFRLMKITDEKERKDKIQEIERDENRKCQQAIELLRYFRSLVWEALCPLFSKTKYNSFYSYFYNENFLAVAFDDAKLFIEYLEIEYLNKTKQQRLKSLPELIYSLTSEYELVEFIQEMKKYAKENNIPFEELGYEYPENIKW